MKKVLQVTIRVDLGLHMDLQIWDRCHPHVTLVTLTRGCDRATMHCLPGHGRHTSMRW